MLDLGNAGATAVNLGAPSGVALTLADGSSLRMDLGGAGSNDKITLQAGATASVAGTTTISLVALSGITVSGTYTLISAPGGGLDTGTIQLGTIYNNSNFTVSNAGLSNTGTALTITATPAAPAPTLYWKGGVVIGADNVLAVSAPGGASNWTSDAAGAAPSPVTPGSSTDVIFSASGSSNKADVLGSNLLFKSLTINDPAGLTLTGSDVGANTLILFGGGLTVNSGAGAVSIGTQIGMAAAQMWTINSNNSLTISGAILSSFGLTKAGTGTLILSADNSATLSKGINFDEGTVRVSADTALGQISNNTLTFDGGTLQYGAVFALNTGRAITLNAGGGTVDTNGFAETIGSTIAGPGGLAKAGAGTLTLSALNTYAGPTSVAAGTLAVTGSISGSAVSVSSGATLSSGPSGTVGALTALVNVLGGGTVAPGGTGGAGTASIGELNVDGSLTLGTLAPGGIAHLAIELGGTTPATQYDQLTTTGAVNLTNVDLDGSMVNGFGTGIVGDLFFIIINGGGSAVSGGFANQSAPDGNGFHTISFGNNQFEISYTANFNNGAGSTFTGGHDVALLAVVPEPGSAAMLLCGLGALAARRYRHVHLKCRD